GSLSSTRRRSIRCAQGDASCEIVAGPGAVWADVREEIRDGDSGGIATSSGEAIRRSASDPGVTIVEPATGREEGYPAIRLHPGAAGMAVDAYGPQDIAGIAQQAGAISRRDFRTGPHDKSGEHDRVRCRSEEPIESMIDGERRTGAREETSAPIRIFHLSDIHFGSEDREASAWARESIARERPDAVAITGDSTMRARHREFAAACDWILSLDAAVTVEVGNHDLPYFNLFERFTDPYRRFRRIEASVERAIPVNGIAIIPLKTTA
ncbi:hypothetical protein OY671_008368, partial [Metschnikowia pulcherrima]